MSAHQPILVVIEPEAGSTSALARGVFIAKRLGAPVLLFSCIYRDVAADPFFDRAELVRIQHKAVEHQLNQLERMAKKFSGKGVAISVKAIWDKPAHEGIIREIRKSNPLFLVKDTKYHKTLDRALFSSTDWDLIRECPCPVWLVKNKALFEKPVIVAAVDPLHENDKSAKLDHAILERAKSIASTSRGILKVVHAYHTAPTLAKTNLTGVKKSVQEPESERVRKIHEKAMTKLLSKYKVADKNVHVHAGRATELLPYLTRKLKANLLVMGAVARSRRDRGVIGTTSEQILDSLPCDILVMKPPGFKSHVGGRAAKRCGFEEHRDRVVGK